jgi:hypothetical protein
MELAIQNRRGRGENKCIQYDNELKAEKEEKENAEREKEVKITLNVSENLQCPLLSKSYNMYKRLKNNQKHLSFIYF